MPKTIHTNEYIKIVEKLKQARLDSEFTQKDAAVRLKKPQSYISKVESGEQRIDILELKSFAKIYNKKIDFFIK